MFWFCKDRFIFILKSICIYIPQSNISLYSSMEVGTPAEGKQFGNESKKKKIKKTEKTPQLDHQLNESFVLIDHNLTQGRDC